MMTSAQIIELIETRMEQENAMMKSYSKRCDGNDWEFVHCYGEQLLRNILTEIQK